MTKNIIARMPGGFKMSGLGRDFARLKKLARKEKWADDTPVPPGVFGPLWPEGVAPYWAVDPPAADAPVTRPG